MEKILYEMRPVQRTFVKSVRKKNVSIVMDSLLNMVLRLNVTREYTVQMDTANDTCHALMMSSGTWGRSEKIRTEIGEEEQRGEDNHPVIFPPHDEGPEDLVQSMHEWQRTWVDTHKERVCNQRHDAPTDVSDDVYRAIGWWEHEPTVLCARP